MYEHACMHAFMHVCNTMYICMHACIPSLIIVGSAGSEGGDGCQSSPVEDGTPGATLVIRRPEHEGSREHEMRYIAL